MKPSYYILIVLGFVLVGLFFWQNRSSAVITLEDITFDRPVDFEFTEISNGVIDVSLRLKEEDVLNFAGQIALFRDYNDYLDRNQDPLQEWRRFKTSQGNNVLVRGIADAGGLLVDYLILIDDFSTGRSGLLMMRKSTYEDPEIWRTREAERRAQHEKLDRLFEAMARSVRFAD